MSFQDPDQIQDIKKIREIPPPPKMTVASAMNKVQEVRSKQMVEAKMEIEYMKIMTELQELKARYQIARFAELEGMVKVGQLKGHIKTENKDEQSSTVHKEDNKAGQQVSNTEATANNP